MKVPLGVPDAPVTSATHVTTPATADRHDDKVEFLVHSLVVDDAGVESELLHALTTTSATTKNDNERTRQHLNIQ